MKNNPTHAVHQATRSNNWDPKSINQKLYNLDHQIHLQPTKSKSHRPMVELKKKKNHFRSLTLARTTTNCKTLQSDIDKGKQIALIALRRPIQFQKKWNPNSSSPPQMTNLIWSDLEIESSSLSMFVELEDFGQKVDLTRQIREVLLNYPGGTTVLKEHMF